jgi:DNA-binding MarR family transcriptional regulator
VSALAADAPEAYRLEDQVGHLLRRAHQKATQIFMAELGHRFDLTPTQYAVLVKLHDAGEQSQNRLGRLTAIDPATVQGVIRRLEERRLVERAPDAADRRRALLRLTAEGAALVRAAMTAGPRVSATTLAMLAPAEQARFLDLLRKLA